MWRVFFRIYSVLPVYCLLSGLSHVCEVNLNHFLIYTSFLRNWSLFFFSVSGNIFIVLVGCLVGGARFRKFGPGFIGVSGRQVDQCQNGIGIGDPFLSKSVFLRLLGHLSGLLLFTSSSLFSWYPSLLEDPCHIVRFQTIRSFHSCR